MGETALNSGSRRTAEDTLSVFMACVKKRTESMGIKDPAPFMLPTANPAVHTEILSLAAERGIMVKGIKDNPGIIIADRKNLKAIEKLARSVLKERARGCYRIDVRKNSLLSSLSGNKDREMRKIVRFVNLDRGVAERLKEGIGKLSPGIKVAEEQGKGNSVSVIIPEKMIEGRKEKAAKALFSSLVRSHGVGKETAGNAPSADAFFLASGERSMINGVDRLIRNRFGKAGILPDSPDYLNLYMQNAGYVLKNLDGKTMKDPEEREQLKKSLEYLEFMKGDKSIYPGIMEYADGKNISVEREEVREAELPAVVEELSASMEQEKAEEI